MKKKGKWTGKAVEDATVIIARKGDEEAKYNGYYETHGWKKDLFIDSSNKIFLSYNDTEINENEGKKIKEKYSRYWKEERYFNPNTSLENKLHFPYKKGEYEMVGAYYRNKRGRMS